jgi:hypothetical protein
LSWVTTNSVLPRSRQIVSSRRRCRRASSRPVAGGLVGAQHVRVLVEQRWQSPALLLDAVELARHVPGPAGQPRVRQRRRRPFAARRALLDDAILIVECWR